MIRILHSSDLHLGKPFGRFSDDVRFRLRKARADMVARLAAVARAEGAPYILLAGDTFDAETPSPQIIRQALNVMREDPIVRWIILPGNHDSLAATELWRELAGQAPANVTLATSEAPIALGDDAAILPAPCTHRRPGVDLTESLDQTTAPGLVRIGLAHGAVTDFAGAGSEDGNLAIIPPDRAQRSGLDYLALGDWHGMVSVGPRQWYAGTPERDGWKHGGRGAALIVEIGGAAAPPIVRPVETGALTWLMPPLDLHPGDDPAARLAALLPPLEHRVNHLVQLRPSGRLSLGAREALARAADAVGPDFLSFDTDLSGLGVEQDATDLDLIDRAGALRAAADLLVAEAADPALSADQRAVSEAALSRLFAFATEAT